MASIASLVSNITYGLGLLSSFGRQVDIVGIYGANSFAQMFADARPMKATVKETSKVMYHPVETGVNLADHHIINQVEIELPVIINAAFYNTTYGQLRAAWINATPLSVKTRTGVYNNMIIANMPHEEEPEMYDAITVALHLTEVQYVVPGTTGLASNYAPADPLYSDTIPSGLQSGIALTQRLLSSASGVASFAALGRLF